MKLEDRVALVTGAGRGIGRAIALALAREGADVVINDIELKGAEEVAAEIESLGRTSMAIEADVSDSAAVDRMVQEALASFDRIDILVNNAGIFPLRRVADTTNEIWDRTIGVILNGTFYCTRAVLSQSMEERRGGRIINIASITPLTADPMVCAYAAAKGGVMAFTKAVAKEVAYLGINVNAIAPGYVDTDMTKRVFRGKLREGLEAKIAIGRLATPEDIWGTAVFLASDDSSYLTGQIIIVDGSSF